MHTLERQADQLMYAGIWPDAPTSPGTAPGPDLSWVLVQAGDRPPTLGVKPKPYVMFVPGGSSHRPEKRWPVEKYGELARILYARGFDIVIIGGPRADLAHAIQRAPGPRSHRAPFASIAMLGEGALAVERHRPHLQAAAPTMYCSALDPALSAPSVSGDPEATERPACGASGAGRQLFGPLINRRALILGGPQVIY